MAAPTVTIRSHSEYVDFLGFVIGIIRCMKALSGNHAYFVDMDKRISDCWKASINCKTPDDTQRAAARFDEVEVDDLRPHLKSAIIDLHERLQWLEEYKYRIPYPDGSKPAECPNTKCRARNTPGAHYCRRCGAGLSAPDVNQAGGWSLPIGYDHPREAMDQIGAAMDRIKCLTAMNEDDELFKRIYDQMLILAKWTRTSLNPSPAERDTIQFSRIALEDLSTHLDSSLEVVVHYLHAYNTLYVNFPRNPV